MKNKLLFVDDESHILEGIKDSLRKHRKEWEMTFVCGGEEAIVELANNTFDILICDMRMPLVEGVDVLSYARKHHPATMRIVLSGYSEVEHTISVSSLAHRYMSKPCEKEELESTIRNSLELSNKLDNKAIKRLAGSVDLLPVGDSRHQALLQLINSNECSITEIAKIVESDIALSSKLLHLVNSAFFRRQRVIDSAREATTYLGTDLIRSLVLADQLFSHAEKNPANDREWIDQLQKHAWLSASVAKHIMLDTDFADAAYTAALLHGIGELVMGFTLSDYHGDGVVSARKSFGESTEIHQEENTSFPDELGAYLLNLWGMPLSIVEAVAFRGNPSILNDKVLGVSGAVHIASYLADLCLNDDEKRQTSYTLDSDYIVALDLTERLEDWKVCAQNFADEHETDINRINSIRAA